MNLTIPSLSAITTTVITILMIGMVGGDDVGFNTATACGILSGCIVFSVMLIVLHREESKSVDVVDPVDAVHKKVEGMIAQQQAAMIELGMKDKVLDFTAIVAEKEKEIAAKRNNIMQQLISDSTERRLIRYNHDDDEG